MHTHEFDQAKYALLRELDARFQLFYHERLSDVLTELRIHHADICPDPGPDELIDVINRNRLLNFVSDSSMKELRDTFERLNRGSFGFCVECGRKIPEGLLSERPTRKLCPRCFEQSLPVVHSHR